MICLRLHYLSSENYVKTEIRDRYNLMCSIEDHYIESPTINGDASSGGDRPLPYNSTKYVLVSFGLTLNLTGSCFKLLKENFPCQTTMYCE